MSISNKLLKLKQILFDNHENDFFNKNKLFGYLKYSDNSDYTIYRRPLKSKKVIAAYDNSVAFLNNNGILLYPNYGNKMVKFNIKFNLNNFPNLIADSKIDLCYFIPYMREVSNNRYVKVLRLNIITDKGQIYHNYPARNKQIEGSFFDTDIKLFEESAIWDLPTAKYPSSIKNVNSFERYYPGLPFENYQYHPISNDDVKFYDKYKNGGFGKYFEYVEDNKVIKLPRFYFYSRTSEANSMHFIGTPGFDSKMNLIGTYRSNRDKGVRICLFSSNDGGRNWFCKYEFADMGEYDFKQGDTNTWGHNYGNPIKNFSYHNKYVHNSISFRKRKVLLNHDALFEWQDEIKISKILNDEYLRFYVDDKHHLDNGNIISLVSNSTQDESISWLINNTISETSNGNNMLFKVKVIDEYTFELRECLSQSTHNVCCRHIHHINRIRDGWLIGTGEIYPNGWVLYAQMKEADTFSVKHAYEKLNVYKLNNSKNSVQRTLGMILTSGLDDNVIYASDHDTLDLGIDQNFKILTNEDISRGSTGVFIGKLSDINDRSKFKCIFEAVEPCFFFQKLNGVLVFCGQRGELAMSFDNGQTWRENRISKCFMNHYGTIGSVQFFDDYIILFK